MQQLEGRRAVLAALQAGRVRKVSIAQGARHAIIDEIRSVADRGSVVVEEVPSARLDALSMTGKHQGVIAEAESRTAGLWTDIVDQAATEGRVPFVLALDGVQDPRNLGALVRSAAAFGVDAVLIPSHRSSPVTETTAKAAAGALEIVPVFTVASLQAAIKQAKDMGLWIVVLAEGGFDDLRSNRLLSEAVCLVVGAEGRGVSRTLKMQADALVRITTDDRFETLNASVAGAIAMYEVKAAREATAYPKQAISSDKSEFSE